MRVLVAEEWTEADHADALACARDVVRRVRAGDWMELGAGRPFKDDRILRALCGLDLLHALAEEQEAAP